jgi:hypothetical protein
MKNNQIDEYHQQRFRLYLKERKLKTMDNVVAELVTRHRKGENIAKHVSLVIGEDHEDYMLNLCRMGENTKTIR